MTRRIEAISTLKAPLIEDLKEMPEKVQNLMDLQKAQSVLKALTEGSNYMKDQRVAWGGTRHMNHNNSGNHTNHSEHTERVGP